MSPGHSLARLYQRYQTGWNHAVVSGGLAFVFAWFATKMAVYSPEWRLTLTAAIFLIGWRWPAWGYAIFVVCLALPLHQISIYIAALALAALILPARWIVPHLDAVLLILAAPALIPWRLAALVPLLAGLWWSERKGSAVGGTAALWLKLCAGMAGAPLDLNQLSGQTLSLSSVQERFLTANSLQTLKWLAEPFTEQLLLHILQILLWAMAGYTVAWAQLHLRDRRALRSLLSMALGAGILAAGYLSLKAWLAPSSPAFDVETGWRWGTLFLAALIAGGTYQGWQYLQRAPSPRSSPVFDDLVQRPAQQPSAPARSAKSSHSSESRRWLRHVKPRSVTDDEDIILIELDTADPLDQT